MACPYFYPVEKFGDQEWSKPPRLPLGDPYTGICCADPLREWRPDEDTLREMCNRGYARKKCPRFPDDAGPDAVRFAVSSERGGVVRLQYVLERGRSPVRHGPMEYSIESRQLSAQEAGELLQRQARAYIESYLRRKSEPESAARNPSRR